MARKLLKLTLLIVTIAIYGVLLAQSRIPVTGHFGGVGTDTPNNFGVRFELTYCGANLPRVFGVFNPVLTNTTLVVDPTTGLISGQIWPNDFLNCGGTLGGTRYNVTAMVNNVPQGPPQCYQVLSSAGTFNLDTAQPCVQVPPPPPPPGFGDYEFNNLTLTGLLQGTSANFTGDVTALSFHFSTTGAHSVCPTGQVANQFNQDFTFGCVPFPSAPVTSVFARTGAVAAVNGDYSFSLISGKLGNTQTDSTLVYPGTFNKAQIWDHTPTASTCAAVAGHALTSVTSDTGGNLACAQATVPSGNLQSASNTVGCTIVSPNSFDTCTMAVTWPVPFPDNTYQFNCTGINAFDTGNGTAGRVVINGTTSTGKTAAGVTMLVSSEGTSTGNVGFGGMDCIAYQHP